MLNLEDLSQFVAFHEYGTLTKVAEEYHISQPTLTRTMKRVEEDFGVPLFDRTANKLSFNEVGEKAVEYAAELLKQADACRENVISYEAKLHSINVHSSAPAPLWDLLPILSRTFPNRNITSKLNADEDQVIRDLLAENCDLAIVSFPYEDELYCSTKYEQEDLYLNVPVNHELAKLSSVDSATINGYNCLLSPEIGIWERFCREKLPNSKFLVQHDRFAFTELIRASSLPCFTTNLAAQTFAGIKNRIDIPITDADAHITFYIVCKKSESTKILPMLS